MVQLKSFDFYSSSITLAYKGKYSYKTTFGGVLTILTFIILATFTMISFIILLEKQNFQVITSTSINFLNEFDFSKEPLMLGISNGTNVIEYDERLYNIEFLEMEYKNNINKTKSSFNTRLLKLGNCLDIQKKYKNYFIKSSFKYNNLNNYLCVPPEQDIILKGKFADYENGYRGVRVYINKCDNKTLEKNNKDFRCYSEEIMNKRLGNINFIYYYIGYNLNYLMRNDSDIIRQEMSGSNFLSLKNPKGYFLTFSRVNYYVDNSLLSGKKRKREFFVQSETNIESEITNFNYDKTRRIDNNTIAFFSFNMDDKEYEYYKTYRKFTDFLAEVGGIFNIVIIISKTLNIYISNKIKIFDIMESLLLRKKNFKSSRINLSKIINNYDNKSNVFSDLNNEKKVSLYKYYNNISNAHILRNKDNNSKIIILKDRNKIKKINKNELNIGKIKLKWYYYFCSIFCLKNLKNNIFISYINLTNHLSAESFFDLCFYYPKIFNYLEKIKDNNILHNPILLGKNFSLNEQYNSSDKEFGFKNYMK